MEYQTRHTLFPQLYYYYELDGRGRDGVGFDANVKLM